MRATLISNSSAMSPPELASVAEPICEIESRQVACETPVAVFWCNDQQVFSIETVEEWIDAKMTQGRSSRDFHVYPLQVFKNKELAHHFVESMSLKKQLVLHRSQ